MQKKNKMMRVNKNHSQKQGIYQKESGKLFKT